MNSFIVILKSMLYFISRVFSIFKTPSFGVVNGALWWFIMLRFWLMISSRGMMDRGMMNWNMVGNTMMNRGSMVDWSPMVDKSSWVMGRSRVVDRFRLVIRFWLVVRFWAVINRGCVVHRFNWAISRGGGVAIHWGIGMNCCHSH